MIKTGNIFPIVAGGKETTADILGVYVYEEGIYIPVIIASTDEFKVFQVLPNGLKDAGKKMVKEFASVVFDEAEESVVSK